MTTNGKIFEYLCKEFPLLDALDFDNPGFLVGDREENTTGVVVSLDCDINTIDYAVKNGANLVVTHHPVIFNPLKEVTENGVVYKAIKNGVSVISMHTNLDVSNKGTTVCLCESLGLKSIKKYIAKDGFALRSAKVQMTADTLAKTIKENLSTAVRYVGEGEINTALVCSGSGGDYIDEAIENGFDALITADVKHKTFIEAINKKIAVFDCGHYQSEDVVVKPLSQMLEKKFKEISVFPVNNKGIKYI